VRASVLRPPKQDGPLGRAVTQYCSVYCITAVGGTLPRAGPGPSPKCCFRDRKFCSNTGNPAACGLGRRMPVRGTGGLRSGRGVVVCVPGLTCGASRASARRCTRHGDRRHLSTPGEVNHSLWTAVEIDYSGATVWVRLPSTRRSWRAGSPRGSHARCDPAPRPRSGRSDRWDLPLATCDQPTVSLISSLIHVRVPTSITVYYHAPSWLNRP